MGVVSVFFCVRSFRFKKLIMDIIISANVESPGKQNVMLTKRCYFVFF